MHSLEQLNARLARTERIWLFLDYDGTLADFAPTPEHILPDPDLIDLVSRLNIHPRLRVGVISGRGLPQLLQLLPVPGLLLAGTYGIEMQTGSGEAVSRGAYNIVRPALDVLKPRWASLIADRQGYYLEDKGWALALHARFAPDQEAHEVLAAAHYAASAAAVSAEFRILDGYKFLEVGPTLAHKGYTVSYLLEQHAWEGAVPVYIGDDARDEEAFEVINRCGGISLVVASTPRDSCATYHLTTPQAVRRWLGDLIAA